jgi:glycerol-3-phosphate dehydrogenase
MSVAETRGRLQTLKTERLKGGILYRDGQFDDARYAIALARTLEDLGGVALNYAEVISLIVHGGKLLGVTAVERESGDRFEARARVVINATGVFAEQIFRMDPAPTDLSLAISRGSHIVLPKEYLPGNSALMIPKTDDGRVLFAIPWHDHIVIGTTDEAVERSEREPRASDAEESFLIEHVARYMNRDIRREDVLSVWAGLRPLVRKRNTATSKLSRDHQILRSPSGLISVTGGKWTTYRKMGQDAVSAAIEASGLPPKPSRTLDLKLHGWTDEIDTGPQAVYGSDLKSVQALSDNDASLTDRIHPALSYRKCEIVWAARNEHARTTEDILARRTRALFLNAQAAIEAAPEVSRILAAELGRDGAWRRRDLDSFIEIAKGYKFSV